MDFTLFRGTSFEGIDTHGAALGGADYVLLAFLAVLIPIVGHLDHRRMERQDTEGDRSARLRAYRKTIVGEWVFTAAVLAAWLFAGRPLAGLGFGFEGGWRLWSGLALAAVLAGLSLWQAADLRWKPQEWEGIRRQIGSAFQLAPRTRPELETFSWLSVTAGICEEVVYRGYLIWALAALWNLPAAVVGSSLIFLLGHLYQDGAGRLKVLAVGLFQAGLFLLTGSLWAPILLHVAIDLSSGWIAYTVQQGEPDPMPVPAAG